jgi:hypothetical protein
VANCASVTIVAAIGIVPNAKAMSERSGYKQEKKSYCPLDIFM